MTGIAAAGALAALALFALLAPRLRQRFGPGPGTAQAALLALVLALAGAALALDRLAEAPGPPAPLLVLADAETVRRAPERVGAVVAGIPRGRRVRLALHGSGPAPERPLGVEPPERVRAEARFSSREAALAWAALEARRGAHPEVLLLGHRPGTPALPEGITALAFRVPVPEPEERIAPLRHARTALPGRALRVGVTVRTEPGDWTVRIAADGRLREGRRVAAPTRSTTDLSFSLPAGGAGTHRLLVELVAADGAVVDRRHGSYAVRPFPRVAHVAPEGPPGPLARLLAASGYPLARAGAEALAAGAPPPEGEVLLLEDVPAADLPWPAVSALARAGAREGTGLLFVGGPRSFTAGGYRDAPVERLLPVTMGIRDPQDEKHRTALVVVLDTSWSMNCFPEGCGTDAERMWGTPRERRGPRVRKIDLARQALLELLPAMRLVDSFGILGVRTEPYWELEPGVLADPAAVEDRVRRITVSGSGILLYSALLEASRAIVPLEADVKHLLVLLDTDDIDEIRVLGVGTVEDLVAELGRRRVSVSFVGFGFSDDRYVPLLHQLATSTGGSLYLTSDVASIPRFLREDREGLAGRQAVRRQLATRHDEAALPGLAGTPPVEGVFVTEAKPDARTLVWTELGYPLVAVRRLERGAVGAFASDGGEEMAPAWSAPAAREAWDAVLAAVRRRDPADGALFVSRGAGGAALWWRSPAGPEGPGPRGALHGPGGEAVPVDFHEVYPGTWRGWAGGLAPGSHLAVVGAAGLERAVPFAVPGAPPPAGERQPDLGRLAPPPPAAPPDGRVLTILLLGAAAALVAGELLREEG